ncbi:MAG TPA: thioesterase family protein [Gordonia sp. (in: high G+C Gram-positive bacteria)]|nr:thioesterase family protein [Gordonia sp. UBA7599]RUP37867.1 MAG: acyl-CoA thioesterase [Gordonia sp. (in: high G+C Gram-positive bacteria)]HNP57483.1 thioesterase family protein [Gordonia sp. (in: high G+C Gram-positive bacteria)]HRC51381.1 thioesterase family protein [Gordonia sp. (in: high G+C Gram-positive bacteria)]
MTRSTRNERRVQMEIPDDGVRIDTGYLVKVPVRWSDMDVFQHINHARMVTLIEEARIPWLFYDERPTAPLRDGCVVVDLHVKYQAQLRHDQGPIEVLMYLEKLRSVDFVVGYEVRAAGADPASKPAVVASTQLASFDISTQRPRRMTDAEKDYLREFLRQA